MAGKGFVKGAVFFSLVLGAASAMPTQAAVTFNDITNWVGSGGNESALVIDWNDGNRPESLVWGYRWDGAATSEDMLRNIVAADSRLTADFTMYDFGASLDALHYNAQGLTGFADHSETTDGTQYWNLYLGGTDTTPSWNSSFIGMSDHDLANGSWDGWSFVPDWQNLIAPSADPTSAPVPEPASLLLFGVIGGACLLGRRRRKAAAMAVAAMGIGLLAHSQRAEAALSVADQVVSYDSGDLDYSSAIDPGSIYPNYNNASATLGLPPSNTGAFGTIVYNVTPFNPPWSPADLTAIGGGGSLVLHLSDPIATNGFTLGIHSATGLLIGTNGGAADPAVLQTHPRDASVSVSEDGQTWASLDDGNTIAFDIPTNYYSQGVDNPQADTHAGTKQADFSKPFIAELSDFDGKSWPQILDLLDGSAGGKWLDLSGTGLNQVNYVKFDVPTGQTQVMFVDAVVGVAVPEPGTAALLFLPLAVGLLQRRRAA